MPSYIQPFVADEDMSDTLGLAYQFENHNSLMTDTSMAHTGLSGGRHPYRNHQNSSYLLPQFDYSSQNDPPYTSQVYEPGSGRQGNSSVFPETYQPANLQHLEPRHLNIPTHPSIIFLRQPSLRLDHHSSRFPQSQNRASHNNPSLLNPSYHRQPQSQSQTQPQTLNQAINDLRSQLNALQLDPQLNPQTSTQSPIPNTYYEQQNIQNQVTRLQSRIQEAEKRIDDLRDRHDFAFEGLFERILEIEGVVFGRERD